MKMTEEQKANRRAAKEAVHLKSCLRNDKRNAFENMLPEPSVKWDVGDRVRYGAWDWTGILATYKGSRVYKCFSVTRQTNRNVPDETTGKIHYEPWHNLNSYRSPEENEAIEHFEQDEDIYFSFQQRDIQSLIRQYLNKYGLDLDPDYQRGHVWDIDQKVNLIDSIFKNIDIGKFAVIKRPWGPDGNRPLTRKLYEVLDGKQRITTIVDYYLGRFQYKGKYYNELGYRDQRHFTYFSVSYAESDYLTQEQKYRYFLKLNTTGTPVDPAHMDRVAGLLAEEIERNECID
jgi:hypothetical protein